MQLCILHCPQALRKTPILATPPALAHTNRKPQRNPNPYTHPPPPAPHAKSTHPFALGARMLARHGHAAQGPPTFTSGLAAYGLHAGGLQAPVHARVPHRRYAGMRGGQVVEAGEHLASRAVRAARVRLALARSVRYEAGPLVALLALPSDALVGAGDRIGRLQVAVALLVPLPRNLGMRRPQVVVVFQHLAVAAVGVDRLHRNGRRMALPRSRDRRVP